MNGADLRAQIERARELLRPSPVRQGHRPAWLMRYLRPLRHNGDSPWRAFCRLFDGELNRSCWLDHWGSTRLERPDGRPEVTGNVLFVSEPYGFRGEMARDLERLRELTGLRWQLESNAWWNPGQTVRILILPAEGEPKSMREVYVERRAKFREELAAIWAGDERPAGAELVSGLVPQ